MLSGFSVGNFCSFDSVERLSLIAGNVKKNSKRLYKSKDFKLLKFAAIYGANASGKSNFIKAMDFARKAVFEGSKKLSTLLYSKVCDINKSKPSYFEFEFTIKDKTYAYGFEMVISEGRFTEEWLVELGQKDTIIYSRNSTKGDFHFNEKLVPKNIADRIGIYFDDFKKVQDSLIIQNLVLNKAGLYEIESGISIIPQILFHLDDISIAFPHTKLGEHWEYLSPENEDLFLDTLKSFSTGISNVIRNEVSIDYILKDLPIEYREKIEQGLKNPRDIGARLALSHYMSMNVNGHLYWYAPKRGKKALSFNEILFEHNGVPGTLYSFGEESDGTKRLFSLLIVLLSKKKDSVFVIDEIDRSLHPQLTLYFVKKFLQIAEKRNVQLIISTHESHLLDLNILRQDEIFFIEKDKFGVSKLFPFDQFKERFDKKIEKAYLEGRYGGVPIFESIFFDEENS